VNLPEGKNLVGNFYQPRLVVIDPLCLKTLAEKEWRNGMAEVIKYGLIRDRPFFDFLDRRRGEILAKKPRALEIMIRESVRNKAEVVARDEREKGMRAILNFGHTFGHAIEKTWDFKKYSHGRAVALGMGMACRYSFSRGILDAPERDAALRLLEAYRLNTALRTERWETIHRNLYYDKKITDRGLTFILIRRIGSVFAEHGVPGGEIRSFLRDCCAPGLTKPRHGRGRTL
jgi:3-dehydroquinate synthase